MVSEKIQILHVIKYKKYSGPSNMKNTTCNKILKIQWPPARQIPM